MKRRKDESKEDGIKKKKSSHQIKRLKSNKMSHINQITVHYVATLCIAMYSIE